MRPLSLAFVDILLHRRGPEDLPASQLLLALLLVLYAVVALIALRMMSATEADTLLVVIELVVDVGVAFIVLHLFGKAGRFLQTATALVGTGILLNLVYIPLLQWNEMWQAPAADLTAPRLLIVVLLIWSFDVAGYILSRALEKPYFVGVCIVVGYEIASLALRQALFPAAS